MSTIDAEMNAVAKGNVEVKFVTIAGKEVEVKYEMRRKKYDIFGLHTKDRKNGNSNNNNNYNKKSGNSDSFKTNSFNTNIGNRSLGLKRNLLIEKHNESSHNGNCVDNSVSNSSNNSIDSKETATNGSANGSKAKVAKALRRLESTDRLPKKSELSIERIANRMAKEKEPVKMRNRFDTLLSSTNAEDVARSGVQKHKKKNKSKLIDNSLIININNSNSYSNSNISDTNSDVNIAAKPQQEFIAQNNSVVVSETVGSFYDSRRSVELFDSNNYGLNNNNNYYNNSDDCVKKVNNKILDIENQQILKVFKNAIHSEESRDRLMTNVYVEELEVDDSAKSRTTKRINPEFESNTTEVFATKAGDTFAPIVRKRQQIRNSDNYSNGGPILKERKGLVDRKAKSKSGPFEPKATNWANESTDYQSILKSLLIFAVIAALLVIYALVILKLFCN